MKKPINKGFTLLESIFSLFILSLSLSLLINTLPLLKAISRFDVSIEEEIALSKLREIILLASDISFNEFELSFYTKEDFMTLTLEKNRIVLKDGYVIYMDDLDNSRFVKKGNCYYL